MGESFKFIHCSDLHLGRGFSGVSKNDPELGKRLRESVFAALDKVVSTAKKEKADFIVMSGDIFDSENETPFTRSRFCESLSVLKIPCFVIYGNHDTKRRWEDSIPLPKNVYVFPEDVQHKYVEKNGVRLAEIVGASYKDGDNPIVKGVRKESDSFGIGIFHCSVDAAAGSDGYAPCRLRDLTSSNIDYWALGHIHKRQVLNEYPHVVYPGNTQGKSLRESGEKGAYIVTVTDDRVTDMRFFRTGPVLWDEVECDITGMDDIRKAVSKISTSSEKGSMLSVTFTGRGPLDNMLRLEGGSVTELIESSTGCTVVSISLHTTPDIDIEGREETGDFISAVLSFGRKLEQYDRNEIIDLICSTQTAENMRSRFEEFTDDELRDIIRDSVYLIIDKMAEAER